MSLDGGVESGPSICTELLAYTAAHFEHEEQLMERYHYPGTLAHKQAHQTFRTQLDELVSACGGASVRPLPLVNAVEAWIHTHMLDLDACLAEFLNQCDVEACHGDIGVFSDSTPQPTARMTLDQWQVCLH